MKSKKHYHVDQTGCTVAAIFFENKSGIPLTPYKERMIDGSELPNAHGSFIRGSRINVGNVWSCEEIFQGDLRAPVNQT